MTKKEKILDYIFSVALLVMLLFLCITSVYLGNEIERLNNQPTQTVEEKTTTSASLTSGTIQPFSTEYIADIRYFDNNGKLRTIYYNSAETAMNEYIEMSDFNNNTVLFVDYYVVLVNSVFYSGGYGDFSFRYTYESFIDFGGWTSHTAIDIIRQPENINFFCDGGLVDSLYRPLGQSINDMRLYDMNTDYLQYVDRENDTFSHWEVYTNLDETKQIIDLPYFINFDYRHLFATEYYFISVYESDLKPKPPNPDNGTSLFDSVRDTIMQFFFGGSDYSTYLWADSFLTIVTLVIIILFTVFVFTTIFKLLRLFMR